MAENIKASSTVPHFITGTVRRMEKSTEVQLASIGHCTEQNKGQM
jgi:hypothetical protein